MGLLSECHDSFSSLDPVADKLASLTTCWIRCAPHGCSAYPYFVVIWISRIPSRCLKVTFGEKTVSFKQSACSNPHGTVIPRDLRHLQTNKMAELAIPSCRPYVDVSARAQKGVCYLDWCYPIPPGGQVSESTADSPVDR